MLTGLHYCANHSLKLHPLFFRYFKLRTVRVNAVQHLFLLSGKENCKHFPKCRIIYDLKFPPALNKNWKQSESVRRPWKKNKQWHQILNVTTCLSDLEKSHSRSPTTYGSGHYMMYYTCVWAVGPSSRGVVDLLPHRVWHIHHTSLRQEHQLIFEYFSSHFSPLIPVSWGCSFSLPHEKPRCRIHRCFKPSLYSFNEISFILLIWV